MLTQRLIGRLLLLSGILVWTAGVLVTPAQSQDRRSEEANVQFHRARTAWTTGNSLLEAKARIDRVLIMHPDDAEALKLRAEILMDLGRPEDAFTDASKATDLAEEDGEAHLILCEAAAATDQIGEAERALDTAANLFLTRIDFYVRLSDCAFAIDATVRAESLARVAIAQDEQDVRGHLQLARVFMGLDRLDNARAIVDRIIEEELISRSTVLADPVLAPLFFDDPLSQ